MNFDTVSLQCFIAVAETGSFTRAAERVGRTQSAVTQQMAKLEQMLGKPLLLRGKGVQLTAEGEIFLGYARRIVALQCEAMDRFAEPDLTGDVRFGLPEDFAAVYLADVLADYTRIHPRILLNVECELTMVLFENFKKKKFDLVLVKMVQPDLFPHGLPVWSEPLEWVGRESALDEGKPLPLVLSPSPCVYRASALQALEGTGRSWRLAFSSRSYASTCAAVYAGMGITVLPRTMIPDSLQALHHKKLPRLNDIHVSLLKHSKTNPAVNSFEEFVLRKMRH
ncbi:MAG: LysR family transcriptional regulator [Alphaproteobacteria bacterium]|nr:LysR family transcriptional regulator [Alphaproteobacteria bacterium]